jgi:hypothetical protein
VKDGGEVREFLVLRGFEVTQALVKLLGGMVVFEVLALASLLEEERV